MRFGFFVVFLVAVVPSCRRASSPPTADATSPERLAHSYFPLVDGVLYKFEGEYKGERYRESLLLRRHEIQGGAFFYFVEEGDSKALFGCMFGLGAYRMDDDGIQTAVADWVDDALERVSFDDGQRMLKLPPQIGDETILRNGDCTLHLTVEGFEDVTVPAGAFQNCVRIRIEEVWPDKKYTGHVWLAEGVGMIRWHKGTGRIDELTSFSKPAP